MANRKGVYVGVSFDEAQLKELDEYVSQAYSDRSKIIRLAIKEFLERRKSNG